MAAAKPQTGEWGGPEEERRTSALGRIATSWWGLAIIGAVVSTTAGILFALPAFGTNHWHDELRIYLAQFWCWALAHSSHRLARSAAPLRGQGARTASVGAYSGKPVLHGNLLLSVHHHSRAFRCNAVEFAESIQNLQPLGDRLAAMVLAHLLGHSRRDSGLPVLPALHEQRTAARAAGAQLTARRG